MKTLNLKIDDNFFPQFKALVDGYVNEHKIEIIKAEQINEAWQKVLDKKARFRYVIDASTF